MCSGTPPPHGNRIVRERGSIAVQARVSLSASRWLRRKREGEGRMTSMQKNAVLRSPLPPLDAQAELRRSLLNPSV